MDETLRLRLAMARLHLESMTEEQSMSRLNVHHVLVDFCETVLSEKPERKSNAHHMTVKGLELLLHGSGSVETHRGEGGQFWRLCDSDMDAGMRNYFVSNIARHMTESGGDYMQRLLCLIADFRWLEARVRLSKEGNDVGGVVDDVSRHC